MFFNVVDRVTMLCLRHVIFHQWSILVTGVKFSALFSGVRKQVTEYGSMSSKNSHLAGSSDVAGKEVIQEFCIKKVDPDDDANEKEIYFMQGTACFRYCVLLYDIYYKKNK